MPGKTVHLKLPDALYERVRQTAQAASRSLEEVLTQSIALSLPPLEEDLPPALRSELAALSLESDEKLHELAASTMAEDLQERLEALAEAKKTRSLSQAEEAELGRLFEEAESVMLRKAEVFRLLARRGTSVFGDSVDAA
jgi:hypothetical protein